MIGFHPKRGVQILSRTCLPLNALVCGVSLTMSSWGQGLHLPPRPVGAPTGTEFASRITSLDLSNREQAACNEVLAGNVPEFYRKFCRVSVPNSGSSGKQTAEFFVAPDYLAVGSDEDYFFMPLTPGIAQRIADRLDCSLPTRKMVNDIFSNAAVRLAPRPIRPSAAMITVPVFLEHNTIVQSQRVAQAATHPLGALVAGDKKDIVITPRLTDAPGHVAIYGWHETNGVPIQPLYLGHNDAWADYSHGVRLVLNKMVLDGKETTLTTVLANPELAYLLSDEGVVRTPRYPTNAMPRIPASIQAVLAGSRPSKTSTVPEKHSTNERFDEQDLEFEFEPEVRIRLNLPQAIEPNANLLLIIYALPNGNTIEQTFGKQLEPGDDWHFDIQHIGAQTRFLRQAIPDRIVVVAYLEAAMKSWPAWRKKHGDDAIPALLKAIQQRLPSKRIEVVLTGHSGGGSLTFGYLNSVRQIPSEIVRIAFLDSNYAYTTSNHLTKLVSWLKASPNSRLCVLAYDDANALLNGKPFVSAAGGTWGRSHRMLQDLEGSFEFQRALRGDLEVYQALAGRVQFLLKPNPDRKILHTVQVERNGFIQALLSGTPAEGQGYEYLGERSYGKWIDSR